MAAEPGRYGGSDRIEGEKTMAKTIKFNLICDNNPIRTIEDLQENFSIEDVLKYYENGLLLRWLEVRGYRELGEKVSKINAQDSLAVIKELIKIFDIETDMKKIEQSVYILNYEKTLEDRRNQQKEKEYREWTIVGKYIEGYNNAVKNILEHLDDVSVIKSEINILVKDYGALLKIRSRELFMTLYNKDAGLAIMCLLMNKGTREYYIPESLFMKTLKYIGNLFKFGERVGKTVDNELAMADTEEMYKKICGYIATADFIEKMGDNIRVYSGTTENYWKDLEPKGKEYMIISMTNGAHVRGLGNMEQDLVWGDIKNNFVILDGINFESNSATQKLVYMEV